MNYSTIELWTIIILLGVGTYFIRFSFLGPLGRKDMPLWVLRFLRYTPVAVIPGLVAPLVIWPAATAGQPDLARLLAAGSTIALGYYTKNVIVSVLGGAMVLYFMLYVVG